jgi:ABC-type amino acid transport system permease subunit
VLIGVVLFAGAYMAEVVRGGLQAMPRGQYEAAMALGLGYWRIMGFVILPQALRLVIPGIVNSFIALFKDTTLVLIVAIFDCWANCGRLCRSGLGNAGDAVHRVRIRRDDLFPRQLRNVALRVIHGAALNTGRPR